MYLHRKVANIWGLEKLSLWQRLNSIEYFRIAQVFELNRYFKQSLIGGFQLSQKKELILKKEL